MKASKIIPAILPKSFDELSQKLSLVAPHAKSIQIDVVDGIFAPNKTWPYADGEIDNNSGHFVRILRQEEDFPYIDEVSFEFDLMISDPASEVDKWIALGASNLIIHIETLGLDKFKNIYDNAREKGVKVSIGISTGTSIETLEKYVNEVGGIDYIYCIQCMGIQRIGFQGEKFDDSVIEKVRAVREKYSQVDIMVDGAVSVENAKVLKDAGATRLVVGSAILKSQNPAQTIEDLENI